MIENIPTVKRLANNPIIPSDMDDRMGDNVNGPSLIKVPSWVLNPLGKYYLYFGHHDGKYIRLAYANDLAGPWTIHSPGVLSLEDSFFSGHVASPDVHVDDDAKQIRLYYHGADTVTGGGGDQSTRVGLSKDGLDFQARPEQLGNPYLRAFQWKHHHYAIAMPGICYRSNDGLNDFEEGPTLLTPNMRHTALKIVDERLQIYFTAIGDSPERIRLTSIDLTEDWMNWTTSDPVDVLRPEFAWEGSNEPEVPSSRGLVHGPVNQLRDPAIYEEAEQTYLLYSVAGESGIAIAELLE